MTVNSQGLDIFDSDWWNPKGSLRPLHKINPLRFNYFKDKVERLEQLNVLDVGCGGGLLSEEFAKEGAQVTGIDIAPVALDVARTHAEESGLRIDYRLTSPSDMVGEENSYDIVICTEVLEHVDNVQGFVSDCSKLLKDGGYFFFSTLNKTLYARVLAIFVAENILNMIPKGAHDYKRFIRPSTLTYILKKNSVTVHDIKGITFDLLTMGFKISNDLSINYLGYGIKNE